MAMPLPISEIRHVPGGESAPDRSPTSMNYAIDSDGFVKTQNHYAREMLFWPGVSLPSVSQITNSSHTCSTAKLQSNVVR